MKAFRAAGLLAGMLAGAVPESAGAQDAFAAERTQLLAEIAGMARATGGETS